MDLRITFKNDDNEEQLQGFIVSRLKHEKSDLGGYVDLFKNVRYKNAYSQSDQILKKKETHFDRNTQIFDTATKSANPRRELGSQTDNSDLYIHAQNFKTVKVMKYFDSELWLRRRTEATQFIQKIIRGFLARKRMKRIKLLAFQIKKEKNFLLNTRKDKIESIRILEIKKRTHPTVV